MAAFPMKDGTLPVLETAIRLRLPVGLVFSGAPWTLYVDGKLMDNDFPLGYPESPLAFPDDDAHNVSEVNLSTEGRVRERAERSVSSLQLRYNMKFASFINQ